MLDPFIGREAALGALDGALAGARGGQLRVTLVEGPPGVGKTALLRRFLSGRPAAAVLRVSAERREQHVAFGLADQLLRRAGRPGALDRATAGGRVLDALGVGDPLILVVDDAQWADRESLDALVFALRRLDAAPLLALVASRRAAALESLRRVAESPGGSRVILDRLTLDELHALARARGCELSGAAVRRLWEHTDADLRHVGALLAEVPADAWHDFERPLPAPRELAAEAAEALSRCAPETLRLVHAAAVLGLDAQLARAGQLAGAGDALAALEEAASARLAGAGRRRGLPTVEFASPARRAAVYEQIGPARRAALHRAAAAIEPDEAVALLHLAAAAPGPDDRLADRLDELARRSRERPEAAAALLAASRLSTGRRHAEDRLIRAVDWMLLAGDAARARALGVEVAACGTSSRRDSVLGQLAIVGDRVRDAGGWLESAWSTCDREAEPELAATIAHRNAFHALIHLRDEEAGEWARRALDLAPEHPLAVEWHATLALTLWRRGRRAEAHAVLERALTWDHERDAPLRGMRAWLLIAGDEIDDAREALAAAANIELRMGAREIGVVHLNVLARAHFDTGAWDEAVAVADRAAALASQLEDVSARAFVWWAAALVPAARGDCAVADRFARLAAAEPTDAPDRVVAVAIARAVPAAARGDAERVIAALAPLTAITPAAAVEEPGFWPWQHLYLDALVSARRVDEAAALLDRHETLAADRRHRTAGARLAVVRGRLEASRGDRARAEEAFERALEALQPLARPYDLALAQLAYGRFLRRDKRRRAGADQLAAAARTLGALGARPALEHAERELVASGLRPMARGTAAENLTPQELNVARLVAAGHRNREVAGDLQLSVKTVEVHLTRIYAKLGIGSRAQLARHLGDLS